MFSVFSLWLVLPEDGWRFVMYSTKVALYSVSEEASLFYSGHRAVSHTAEVVTILTLLTRSLSLCYSLSLTSGNLPLTHHSLQACPNDAGDPIYQVPCQDGRLRSREISASPSPHRGRILLPNSSPLESMVAQCHLQVGRTPVLFSLHILREEWVQ